MNGHRRLAAWQSARRLVGIVYRVTGPLPPDERWISTPQIKRAAWSVQNNIAEGNAKLGRAEMRRFFDTAFGSLAEVDGMLLTLSDLYPVDPNELAQAENLRRTITAGLFSLLRRR